MDAHAEAATRSHETRKSTLMTVNEVAEYLRFQPVPALHLLSKTTAYIINGCGRYGGDLFWEDDRDAGPGRPPEAYGCLQCARTA